MKPVRKSINFLSLSHKSSGGDSSEELYKAKENKHIDRVFSKPSLKEKEDLWNFIFAIIFVFIFTFEISLLKNYFISINFGEIILLSLALFRMTRLAVYDGVTQFFRDWFLKISYTESGEVVRDKYSYGFKKSVSDILGCPWCSSVWMALFMIPLFIFFKAEVMVFSLIMVISGLATFLLFLTHLIRAYIDVAESKIKK